MDREMCDLHIISKEGTRHPVHSLILAAASPVFKVMVTKDFKELQSKVGLLYMKLKSRDRSRQEIMYTFLNHRNQMKISQKL